MKVLYVYPYSNVSHNLSYVLAEKPSQRILMGEFTAGDIPLSEVELKKKFVVSRTTMREAVKY